MDLTNRNTLIALNAPVLAVELATAFNLTTHYQNYEEPLPAILIAASFSALLVGTELLIARNIPWLVRGLLIAGGVLLFLVQGGANVSEAFLHTNGVLPTVDLRQLWGGSDLDIRIRGAAIFGGVLSIVAALYWIGLGLLLRSVQQEGAVAAEAFDALLRNRSK